MNAPPLRCVAPAPAAILIALAYLRRADGDVLADRGKSEGRDHRAGHGGGGQQGASLKEGVSTNQSFSQSNKPSMCLPKRCMCGLHHVERMEVAVKKVRLPPTLHQFSEHSSASHGVTGQSCTLHDVVARRVLHHSKLVVSPGASCVVAAGVIEVCDPEAVGEMIRSAIQNALRAKLCFFPCCAWWNVNVSFTALAGHGASGVEWQNATSVMMAPGHKGNLCGNWLRAALSAEQMYHYMLTNSFANSSLCPRPNPDSSQYSAPRAEDTSEQSSHAQKTVNAALHAAAEERSLWQTCGAACSQNQGSNSQVIKSEAASSISSLHHTSVAKPIVLPALGWLKPLQL